MFTKPKTPKASRKDQKVATKARVLDVARAQLTRDGYEATSIRSVAAEAGVAPGTVLLHFKDKQDLLHAALFDDLARTWEVAKGAAKRQSLSADLRDIAAAFFEYYSRHPSLSRTLLREALFAGPPWNERFAAQIADVHAHVTALAGEARARGEISDQIDPPLLGVTFLSFYYFVLLAWVQGAQPDPLGMFQRMLNQHLKGFQKPSSKGKKR